jgi:hypothetical protein
MCAVMLFVCFYYWKDVMLAPYAGVGDPVSFDPDGAAAITLFACPFSAF